MRYLAGRAADVLSELNPIASSITAEERLRDREFQLLALHWREEHLLGAVARRLEWRIDGGMDSFQALVECQDHLVETARAHVERVVLEQFAAPRRLRSRFVARRAESATHCLAATAAPARPPPDESAGLARLRRPHKVMFPRF